MDDYTSTLITTGDSASINGFNTSGGFLPGTHTVSGQSIGGPVNYSSLSNPGSSAGSNGFSFDLKLTPAPACCVPGSVIGVHLPSVNTTASSPFKPLDIDYSPLDLTFTMGTPSDSSVRYTATSNVGSLTVQPVFPTGAPLPTIFAAQSQAAATVTEFTAGSVAPMADCFTSNASNNYELNPGVNGDTFLSWQSSGFTTTVFGQEPKSLSTGNLTYYVDITQLGLDNLPFNTVLNEVEPYIHEQLIDHLDSVAKYTMVIIDPGKVSLSVTDPFGNSTGIDLTGELNSNIPNSFYLTSSDNPAVVIFDPSSGKYEVEVTGVDPGSYELGVSATNLLDGTLSNFDVFGDILSGEVIPYDFKFTTNDGVPLIERTSAAPEPSSFIELITAAATFVVVEIYRRRRRRSKGRLSLRLPPLWSVPWPGVHSEPSVDQSTTISNGGWLVVVSRS